MRAARVVHHGPPESVTVEEVPDPVAGPGQVVVDIAYAAVNFPDVLIVANEYQVSLPVPFIPGSEFSGVVSTVGEAVENGRGRGPRLRRELRRGVRRAASSWPRAR